MLTRAFVVLIIQHAIRISHIVICGLSGSSIFFHIIAWFSKKRSCWTWDVCFDFLSNVCLKHFWL